MTTHLTWAEARRVAGVFVIPLAVLVVRPAALAAGGEVREPVAVPGPAEAAQEQEQALEREEAQKLRRMREELETRRRQAAHRLEAERARQTEIGRVRATVMTLQQRESALHHEARSMQRNR